MKKNEAWKALAIVGLAFLIYGFGLGREFVFDDVPYIPGNLILKRPDALRVFWTTSEAPNYYPVFWTLLRAQWLLWGDQPFGYNLVNLVLHAVNAVLVWRIARALRLPWAWAAGCLFAIHPVNVQTVAWAAEQKNTWSFLFLALTVLTYIQALEKPGWGRSALSLGCFALALGSKSSVVALPVFLAIWQAARGEKGTLRRLAALTPFFVLAFAGGVTTLWFEKHSVGAHSLLESAGLWHRLEVAGANFWFYLAKALLPIGLTPMYRGWTDVSAAQITFVPVALAAAAGALCVAFRKRIPAPVLLGLAYYAVMLLPLLGIFDTNYFQYSLIADHWQYHALPGVLIAALSLADLGMQRFSLLARVEANGGGIILILGVAALASLHFAEFEDAKTLWSSVVARNPEAWMGWYNLGNVYADQHSSAEAIQAYEHSLAIVPGFFKARLNLANAFAAAGRLPEANAEYLEAATVNNGDADLFNNHGVTLLRLGRVSEAIAAFSKAVRLEPGKASARENLICIALRSGDLNGAQAQLDPPVPLVGYTDANCHRIAEAIRAASGNTSIPREGLLRFGISIYKVTGSRNPDLKAAVESLRTPKSGL